jgi:predicted dehydrogenase/threonine dehydrogenase-like Zn-dependent dehydrogenase
MKQLFQNLRNGEIAVLEIPVPSPRPAMALVRTAASLVSPGTERSITSFAGKSLFGKARARPDLFAEVLAKARRDGLLTTFEAARSRLDEPMPLGYSSAGTIVALGEDMGGFRAGMRVACGGGGYAVHAEYSVVPRNLLAPLPDNVDFESAAFTTLGAVAIQGFRLADAGLGDRVAVIGLGLLGVLTAGIALAAGSHVLGVDLDLGRVRFAERIGAEAVLRAQAEAAARAFSRGRGCDAVIICADTRDSDPVELAGQIARDRAKVVAVGAVGMDIPRNVYYQKELTFRLSRSYGPGRYDPTYEEQGRDYPLGYVRWTEGRNMEAFIDLMGSGRLLVRPMISHRFPIESAPHAYDLITGKQKEPYLGVLLTYPEVPALESAVKVPILKHKPHDPDDRPGFSRLRLGVLGAGNFATAVALPAIQKVPGIELAGIASASGSSAQNAAGRFGFKYATGRGEEILDDPEIDGVAIFTRHNLHASQTVAALDAGKHVYCEKPPAIRPDELDEIRTALRSDRIYMVGYNRRFAPLSRELSAFLGDRLEPVAAHYRVNAGYLPPGHWLHDPDEGGGRIVGEACHFIDYLTFLVGEPPYEISAAGLPDGGRYREDNVIITMGFPDGSVGTVSYLANGDRSFPKEKLEVFSGGRVAVLDDFRSLEMVGGGKSGTSRTRLRQDKGHRAAWEAFTSAVLSGGSPPIPYEHIFGVTQASFAAVEALRSGEKVRIFGSSESGA